ncbi:uncharacterized protein GGS25DRAFT_474264 [Hypoxylon fragiforme]|uniref:uncharacterized protein n=1 Tax=Hypoxylon fragiforme TaxID=63214 RepID=UPI0020C65959|nr:uncharacterized protein GGS25DRAFT_474264 [Hypoxylon fragiforme]KAI2612199.1 hypothetical protein GGS25DRAFT_474264 [Hypoxylon fragiforme]
MPRLRPNPAHHNFSSHFMNANEIPLEVGTACPDPLGSHPALLGLPINRGPSERIEISPDTASDELSEYVFPLPPTNSPSSHSRTSRSRSPFPPPYSLLASSRSSPKDTRSWADRNVAMNSSPHVASHIQPRADHQSSVQSKPLPTKPPPDVDNELRHTEKGKQQISHLTRVISAFTMRELSVHRADSTVNVDSSKQLPPSTPNQPAEPSLLTGRGERRQPVHRQATSKELPPVKPLYNTDGARAESSATHEEVPKPKEGQKQRLTPEQMIWLHQNYRGEATFLKAWGLHITKDADRELGLGILRELMAAELGRGRETPRPKDRGQMHYGQHGEMRPVTPSSVVSRDWDEGLHSISEERGSRAVYLDPTRGSLIFAKDRRS